MKQLSFFLLLIALLAACTSSQPIAEGDVEVVSPESTEQVLVEVVTEPSPTPVPVLQPTVALEVEKAVATHTPPTEPTAIPTNEPTLEPTEMPTEETAAETAVIAGRLDEGAFFLGAPDAPVTMIDYSDFL